MDLDLAVFDDVEDRVLLLRLPVGDPVMDGDKPITITFVGRDTPAHTAARNALINANRLQASRAGSGPTRVQDEEENYLTFLGAITKAWSSMPVGGQRLECNPKNAAKVYTRVLWVRRAVDAFLIEKSRSDFTSPAA